MMISTDTLWDVLQMIEAGEKKRERNKGLGRGKKKIPHGLSNYKFTKRPARDQDIHG